MGGKLNGLKSAWNTGFKGCWEIICTLSGGLIKEFLLGPVLGLTLFNMFISDLEEEKEWTLISFVHDTKLADEVNVPYGTAGIQGDQVRLEDWADMSLMKFRKDLCKVLHFTWSTVYCAVS